MPDTRQASDLTVWCHSVPVVVPSGQFDDHADPRCLVRFIGPIRREWKETLAARGCVVEFWAPPFGAVVTLPSGLNPSDLRQFEFLAGAIAYTEELCRRPLEPHGDALRAATGMAGDIVDIVCFNRPGRAGVERALAAMGVTVLDASSVKLRVRYDGDLARLRDIEGVKLVGTARGPVLLGLATLASSLGAGGANGDWISALDGSGEIIAVADTGLDSGADGPGMHADFRGRVAFIASLPPNASWAHVLNPSNPSDGPADLSSGHGTHVAGLALGTGAAGGGAHRGAAPGAKLVFQALEHFCQIRPEFQNQIKPGFYLSGRPLDLRDLFRQARDQGARIHVNSWGDPAAGGYTDDCHEADLFLHENSDALILFAAGNDGADRDGDGRIDSGSLYAPASAKNVVAIGATEGPLADVGLRRTWADFDPNRQRYRNPVDRVAPVSGAADRIACFSSAGPAADGRIKPDLCAPGTNIAGPRSQRCNGRGWSLADPLPLYMYEGGSSTANGLAGGMCALLRQAWRTARGNAPSGAALKALLILGAQPVRGRGNHDRALPSEAGYGRISLAACLPDSATATVRLFGDDDPGLETGERRSFPVDMPAGGNLRAVLCWYDAPGGRLINDLDLGLHIADSGAPVAAPAAPDRTNTVELIEATLAPGRYVLTVDGFNVPAGPQRFALAVSVRADAAAREGGTRP